MIPNSLRTAVAFGCLAMSCISFAQETTLPLNKPPTVAEEIRLLKESLSDIEKKYLAALDRSNGKRPSLTLWNPAGPPVQTNDCGQLNGTLVLRQVVSKNELLVSGKGAWRDTSFWMEGVSNGDATTDQDINFGSTVFVCIGTKTYNNVIGGSVTVKHLIAVDTANTDTAYVKIRELREFRKWSDPDGEFEAKLVEFKNNNVYLQRRSDGKQQEIPMVQLGQEEQKWVRDELKRRLDANKKPAKKPAPRRK